jgi:hypothetical protein
MSNKEQRSVAQVRELLGALGWLSGARIRPDIPPRPDVFVEIDNRRIAIETTDYHGDEMRDGGSAVRRQEGSVRSRAMLADSSAAARAARLAGRAATSTSG